MKQIQAGKFDRRITFRRRVDTPNSDYGGSTSGWEDHVTVWAQKTPFGRSVEVFTGDALRSNRTEVFRIRYRTDITVQMQLVYNGKVYNVRGTEEPADTRKTVLDIYAEVEE